MGGKGGGGGPSQDVINQQAYAAGAAGDKWSNITHRIPYGHESALDSWKQGQASTRNQGFHGGAGKPYDFFTDYMKKSGFHDAQSSQQSSYEASMQANIEAQRQAEEERRRIEGENRRDSLYSNYLDAAGSATDYVNTEISRELANAQLLGIDYDITDEAKSTRINDYFATIWGEGQQSQLEALMGEWGNPKGFEGFTIVRGDESTYAPVEGEEKKVGESKGMKGRPGSVLDEEEQVLGGQSAILGV